MFDHAPSPNRLAVVAAALAQLDLGLAAGDASAARDEARRLLDDYLGPRMTDSDRLVVAVVGVSGAGKSTLVNSVARRRISEVGTRRPTTIEPVAWGHDELPATLDGLRSRLPGRMVDTLRPPPDGVTVVDTPPPGVLDQEGRAVAAMVVDVADAVVHVAGAHRYADAAGFELAERATRRGLPVVFVLNRVPATQHMQHLLTEDYAGKLHARGLIDRPDTEEIVVIAEGPISTEADGLGADRVTGLRKELERLADPQQRRIVVRAVAAGTLSRVEVLLDEVRSGVIDAATRRVHLHDPVRIAYAREMTSLRDALLAGRFASVAGHVEAVVDTLASATARRAGRAAAVAADRWERTGGPVYPGMFAHGDETLAAARDRVGWWMSEIPSIAEEVGGKPVRGRRRAQLVAAVTAAVIDPDRKPDRSSRRLLDRHPGIVSRARRRLADELVAVIRGDAGRFIDPLGGAPPSGVLADLTVDDS